MFRVIRSLWTINLHIVSNKTVIVFKTLKYAHVSQTFKTEKYTNLALLENNLYALYSYLHGFNMDMGRFHKQHKIRCVNIYNMFGSKTG